MTITVRSLTGSEFEAALSSLADLRIRIFREWPYLYDGDLEYEERYLARFIEAERAILAVATDGERILGAATAAPLSGEAEEFRKPFEDAGLETGSYFYFAESLLLPEYRGHGIGHRFFDIREEHARSFGQYTHACFCTVVRPHDHPARPHEYRPLDAFWIKRGFRRAAGLVTTYAWTDVGQDRETGKPMQFWTKRL